MAADGWIGGRGEIPGKPDHFAPGGRIDDGNGGQKGTGVRVFRLL
jgi:hypothetical protein